MLKEILDMIFAAFKSVINAFDVPIYENGGLSFTFWQLILGIFTMSIVFGFFLRTRSGSVFGAVKNLNDYERRQNTQVSRENK